VYSSLPSVPPHDDQREEPPHATDDIQHAEGKQGQLAPGSPTFLQQSQRSIIGPPCPARLVYSSLCRVPPHDDQREKPPHAADDTRRHRPGIDVRSLLHQRTAVRRLVLQVQVSK